MSKRHSGSKKIALALTVLSSAYVLHAAVKKSVLKTEGIVKGSTESISKKTVSTAEAGFEDYGYKKTFDIDLKAPKKVLITGRNSYIGNSFEKWAKEYYPNISIDVVDMQNTSWHEKDFSLYDTVFHVAGIAHSDTGHVDEKTKARYYAVNTDLAVDTAEKAKAESIKQFIFISSMMVYGDSAACGKKRIIGENTEPNPADFYGDSKWQADRKIRGLSSEEFRVAVLRLPMVYGRGSKGNYSVLSKIARKLPIFPNIDNSRSMLYIDNLCEFLCRLVLSGEGGIYFPQNDKYTRTADMVRRISESAGKKIIITKLLNPAVAMVSRVPGKTGRLVNKAFGNNVYSQKLSNYKGLDYRVRTFEQSVEFTEKGSARAKSDQGKGSRPHILIISQYFYPELFRINDIAAEWVKRGYKVTVLTGIPNYPMGKFYDGYDYTHHRRECWNGIDIIRISLIPRGSSSIGMVANYFSFVASGFFWKITNNVHADLVFTFETSPMTQALIGVWYGKKHHIPHFLYVQDLWPENVEMVTGIHHPAIIKPIDCMVDYIYKNTDRIFATSQSLVEAIVDRKLPVSKKKVYYWPQYAEEFYRPLDAELVRKKGLAPEIPDDSSFKIMYAGNLGYAQGLDILPKTAEILKNEDIKFVVVGDGRYQDKFNQEIKQRKVQDKFVLIPKQDATRIPVLLSVCDIAYLSYPDPREIPAKLQSYIACGKCVLASAGKETRNIIEEGQCGICCEFGDERGLSKAILSIKDKRDDVAAMGKNARKYFLENFEKSKLMDEMDKYFETYLSLLKVDL